MIDTINESLFLLIILITLYGGVVNSGAKIKTG